MTGRAAVLALVLLAVALTLAYPVRGLVDQRAEISQVRDQVAATEQRVEELREARARWDDPAYVRAQARDRLHYVLPGETQYVVVDPATGPAPGEAVPQPRRSLPPDRPWYDDLWDSVGTADRAGPEAAGDG